MDSIDKSRNLYYNGRGDFMWQIGQVKIKNQVVLAPMAGISIMLIEEL